jgi:hypothetical protein
MTVRSRSRTPTRARLMAGIRMNPFTEGVRQHVTHTLLTPQTGPQDAPSARLELDAIVVPRSRSAVHRDHAVTLARAADCWLLILCSRRQNSAEVRKFLAARSYYKAIVIDLPPGGKDNYAVDRMAGEQTIAAAETLVGPGLVPCPRWRPDPDDPDGGQDMDEYCALGRR